MFKKYLKIITEQYFKLKTSSAYIYKNTTISTILISIYTAVQ